MNLDTSLDWVEGWSEMKKREHGPVSEGAILFLKDYIHGCRALNQMGLQVSEDVGVR